MIGRLIFISGASGFAAGGLGIVIGLNNLHAGILAAGVCTAIFGIGLVAHGVIRWTKRRPH